MRVKFVLNKDTMAISEQLRFYDDNIFSQIRIGMLIRKNLEKSVVFVNGGLSTEQIVVVIKPDEIIIHIPNASLFEYSTGPLTTLGEINEIEENDPDNMFSPEELMELGLFTAL